MHISEKSHNSRNGLLLSAGALVILGAVGAISFYDHRNSHHRSNQQRTSTIQTAPLTEPIRTVTTSRNHDLSNPSSTTQPTAVLDAESDVGGLNTFNVLRLLMNMGAYPDAEVPRVTLGTTIGSIGGNTTYVVDYGTNSGSARVVGINTLGVTLAFDETEVTIPFETPFYISRQWDRDQRIPPSALDRQMLDSENVSVPTNRGRITNAVEFRRLEGSSDEVEIVHSCKEPSSESFGDNAVYHHNFPTPCLGVRRE
jgi:hypothetical protein